MESEPVIADRVPTFVGIPLERRRWRWGLMALGWMLLTVLLVLPGLVDMLVEDDAVDWPLIVSQLVGWHLWALFVPLVWWAVGRYPVERRRWRSRVGIHVGLALVVTTVYNVLSYLKSSLISDVTVALTEGRGWWAGVVDAVRSAGSLGLTDQLLATPQTLHLVTYCALLAATHAALYYFQYQRRASRLETQLAQAQLKMLKMQLHPHFLFNTLNAISALMHRDVEDADRMITLLSDLLRLSLEKDDRHQVPLRRELDFLGRYLAIEEIRFRDRLKVELDIPRDCLGAQVPKLVLQPLVENSIRHGIAVSSAASHVAVRARRRGDRLDLQVADDGPGMSGATVHEGVGLANTRARLEQLYGEDHRFELRNSQVGGFEVVLEIPFEEHSRFGLRGAA